MNLIVVFLLLFSFSLQAQKSTAGKTYYVSSKVPVRADGLSKTTPVKDLQKAIDMAEDGGYYLSGRRKLLRKYG